MLRREVLSLYRRILKIARNWKAVNPENTPAEQLYIKNEVRAQIRENKNHTEPEKIKKLLEEAEKRIGIAQHYGIPYPKPEYYSKGTTFDVNAQQMTFKIRQTKPTLTTQDHGTHRQ
uniref:Complex 1 LYR protein domain-containing protein n=1 Tax=Acrobeloides nanus TaxID=290746 RepID=A0A914E6L5_9BILA